MSDPYVQEFVDLPGAPSGRGEQYRLGLHVYPDPGPAAPVVLVWPALGTAARFYRPFAQALSAAGIAVIVADVRGTGASTPRPTRADRYGYPELVDDVGTVIEALKPRLDGRPCYLLGHSLSGQICALHLATTGRDDIAGLMLVAVGLPYHGYYASWPWPKRMGVLGVTQAVSAIAAVNRVSPGWSFGGRAARNVILDWGYTARTGRYRPIDGTPVDLGRVRTPVLAISVPRDRLTPGSTLDVLCGWLSNAPVERVHLDAPVDHFSWIRTPDAVAAHVIRFVSAGGRHAASGDLA